ncbi:hypothetical protein AN216_00450, partial [Streptomyces oceani]
MRPVVVRRLLELREAKILETVHVRIVAESVGVSERTVWRWLAQARSSGRVEPAARRGGFVLDDALWSRLADLGGNVSALYRWMTGDQGAASVPVPSLATVLRAVRRDLRAGRGLEVARPARGYAGLDRYDRALAELALPGTVDEAGQALSVPAADQAVGTAASAASAVPAESEPAAAHTRLLFGRDVRLYAPGAHVVSTRQVGEVTEALAHTVAARGLLCVYGDTGHGKTVAVHQALGLLPRRLPVHQALVAVKPALPQLRAALLTAFGLSAPSLVNRTEAADRALIDALKNPGVLVIDDVQRIAAPELDYLRLLVDAPTTQASLVLCGAGAERTLARAPALASRVLTW